MAYAGSGKSKAAAGGTGKPAVHKMMGKGSKGHSAAMAYIKGLHGR